MTGVYVIRAFQDVDERTRKEKERTRNDRRMCRIIRKRYVSTAIEEVP